MRYKLIIVGFIAGLAFFVQPCYAQFDSSKCPPPVGYNGFGTGANIPGNYDMMQQLSPNGKMLGYLDQQGDNGAHILNLATLADTLVQVNGGLPGEQDFSWTCITWCPYDSDLIALNVVSFVDTSNSGISDVYVNNIFTYRISTGKSELITPRSYGYYGDAGIAGGEIGNQSCWLSGSMSGNDSLLIYAGTFYGIYVPQTQTLIPLVYKGDTSTISPFGNDTLTSRYIDTNNHPGWFLNSQQIVFPRAIDTNNTNVQWTFSPDAKLFALQITPDLGNPTADSVYPQVWVYDVSDPIKAIDVIDFQQLYCKYSLDGIWPEFITDSTLAVSMYTDGDNFCPLWEITIDGRIIRQLTFLPAASVVENEPINSVVPLRVFPNPATDELQILGGQAGTIHLFDIMGRERMNANDDGAGATLDVSRLEPGIYFLRMGNQSTKVEISR
jgi:hypothetical protein